MANKNVILVDEEDNELNPATTAEQIEYVEGTNAKQKLAEIEDKIERYEE